MYKPNTDLNSYDKPQLELLKQLDHHGLGPFRECNGLFYFS